MPRDGANIYHRPPGTDAVPDTTIESSKYNAYVADIEQDLNLPRPIVAGGTGASDAITAMTNLGGEIASQQVTNYDSFPFKPGSFWSAGGATSAPNGVNRFTGICTVINDGTGDLAIQATIVGTGVKYDRRKNGGVWTPWSQMSGFATDLDAAYVNVTGDTMSGPLGVTPKGSTFGGPSGTLSTGVVTQADANIMMYNGGGANWCGFGTDTNGDFWLRTGLSGTPIPALRVANNQSVSMSGTVTAGSAGAAGIYYFGNSGTKTLNYDGVQFNLSGGALFTSNNITAGGSVWSVLTSTTGTYYFGNSGTKYLQYDGTNFNLVGGPLISPQHYIRDVTAPAVQFQNTSGGVGSQMFHTLSTGVFTVANVAAGGLGLFLDISGNLNVSTGTAYKPGGGTWTAPSDARIKTVVGDYTPGLEAITQLAPRRFTYKGNDTPTSDVSTPLVPPTEGEATPKITAAPYPSSPNYDPASKGTEFIGLIAQEIEAIFPGMVTTRSGYIDGEAIDDLRVVDTTPLIYALVNAVKELSAKVAALEAK